MDCVEQTLVNELLKQLQPAFYGIGAFTVMLFVIFGSTMLKILREEKKEKNKKSEEKIEALGATLVENTKAIYRLEVKLDLYADQHDKDLNALGDKIRSKKKEVRT